MLRKEIYFFCLVFSCLVNAFNSNAQGVDFSRVEFEVNNPLSKFYYPSLYSRYVMLDTTLTDKEYYYLYYGFPAQDDYKPLLINPLSDSLRTVLDNRRNHSADVFFTAIDYAKKILQTEPFNLREINVLIYAYEMLGNRDAALKEAYRFRMITKVITSTGNGETAKTPWWVTYPSHADDILAMRKYTANKTVAISRDVVYIQAHGENKKRSNVFYFNYSLQYLKKPEYLYDQNGNKIKQGKKRLF